MIFCATRFFLVFVVFSLSFPSLDCADCLLAALRTLSFYIVS